MHKTNLRKVGGSVMLAVPPLMLRRIAQEKALPFDPLVPNATTIAAISGYAFSSQG